MERQKITFDFLQFQLPSPLLLQLVNSTGFYVVHKWDADITWFRPLQYLN